MAERCLMIGGRADGNWVLVPEDIRTVTIPVRDGDSFAQQQYTQMCWLIGEKRIRVFTHDVAPEEVWRRLLDAYHTVKVSPLTLKKDH